jgi:hypothetical protein
VTKTPKSHLAPILATLALAVISVFGGCTSSSVQSQQGGGSTGTTATNCTIFASASGNDSNSGTTAGLPKSLNGAANAATPGSVVCLEAGTYNTTSGFTPPRNGTSEAYITYQGYGNGTVNFVWNGGNGPGTFMFNLDSSAGFPNGHSYLRFSGLNLNGQNQARNGFFARYSHHLVFSHNFVANTGGSGIACIHCDYITSDHNAIWHNGYVQGGTSAITYNETEFYDNYAGIHNIISNNIAAGESDTTVNTDGNGIIMDRSASGATGVDNANTPPGLILNNVVYMNSGDCIINFIVSNIWTINNSCYKNQLNTSSTFLHYHAGEVGDNSSRLDWYVNNIAYTWSSSLHAYFNDNTGILGNWYNNMYWVGEIDFTPTDPSEFFNDDPEFVDPLSVNPTATGQFADAPNPESIGDAFRLQASSPAIGKGIDPTTLPNVPSAIITDLKNYIYTDISGKPRAVGGSFDLGAYTH